MDNNSPFVQKYFPKTFDDVLLPKEIKMTLQAKMAKGSYRLMLHSTPGTGKTTTARLMTVNDEVLYMSGCNDILIDVFRNKIIPFITGFSYENKQRTLIIDEADGMSNKIQEAFKMPIEQCKNVNFIFLTNNLSKMDAAIISRCGGGINYEFSGPLLAEQKTNFVEFAVDVCAKENIKWTPEGLKYLYLQIFPDFRMLLNNLEKLKEMNLDITIENISRIEDTVTNDTDLYDLISNPAITDKVLYESMSPYFGKERQVLISLGEPWFKYLNNKGMFKQTLASGSIVSKYCGIFDTAINKPAILMGLVSELKTLFR